MGPIAQTDDATGCADPGVGYEHHDGAQTGFYVQARLPHVRAGLCLPGARTACHPVESFAHPFERTFAELLTFYGIRWAYEPTSFALSWCEDGSPREMFTPDFYLPDHGLYIELTAMRQRLVTRKHRKVRQMRLIYPQVDVKLLYRRDYQRLARAYGKRSGGASPPGATLRGETEIRERLAALGVDVAVEFAGDSPPVAIGVGAGGVGLLEAISDVQRSHGDAEIAEYDRIEVARFRVGGGDNRVRVTRRPRIAVAGRRVMLFVDIVSTGLTLSYIDSWLRKQGAVSVDVCALLDRETARVVDIPIKHIGFLAPDELVVGFGLNLFREYRGLAHIAALGPDALAPTPDEDRGRHRPATTPSDP